tara:strand:+ start:1395 stop:3713 length:2319 start_codon:yes stop_codon:yes gene_type:complete
MIILIPLGGIGNRFKEDGYKEPKALIKVNGKEIIYYLLDNIKKSEIKYKYIYIPYNYNEYKDLKFEEKINDRYDNIKFLKLMKNTEGPAETLSIALEKINEDDNILCMDSDTFYEEDVIKKYNGKNMVFSFKNKNLNPIFSYIKTENNIITDIEEKVKISDNACCGIYCFESLKTLEKYCNKIIKDNKRSKNEYYISTVIKEMLKEDYIFNYEEIENKNIFSLGTPKQVKEYEESLLLDLDGTLVNTDEIYYEVWKEILKEYEYDIDIDFFNYFIKGNSDKIVVNNLLPNEKNYINISNKKDELFCSKLNKGILFDGVHDFLERNANRIIGIITSCNKKALDKIMEICNIIQYINFIITANDVNYHKPSPEPYLKACKLVNIEPNKCIVIEDSMKGYMSALNAKIGRIIIKKCYDKEFEEVDCEKFENYEELDLNIKREKNKYLKDYLTELPIKEIILKDNFIKTGYICNIEEYKLKYNDNSIHEIIVKIPNNNNELYKTAENLDMYNNEAIFYKKIAKNITCINIPKCYNITSNNEIILENLKKYNGKFNVNLSKDINLLLDVIKNIAKLHYQYYFENKEQLLYFIKDVKISNNYYKKLIEERFKIFIKKNTIFLNEEEIEIFYKLYNNFNESYNKTIKFPLSFCHGDLKSPNIFYKDNNELYFLDWQYIQLNKGISDIIFLLIESIEFNEKIVNVCLNYYYQLIIEKNIDYNIKEYKEDIKSTLNIFPFFVCVWFNSERSEKLIDKSFPLRFMKNYLLYCKYFNSFIDVI